MFALKLLSLVIVMLSNSPILTFGFSTVTSRINNLKPPQYSGEHEVLVSLQSLTKAPYSVDIPNSRLIQSCDSGVAKSRNVVLDNSLGKYLVFGDDDITFIESGLIQVIQFFEEHPECAIILAQAINDFGMPRKKYKKYISPLRLTNTARAATYEIVVRLGAIRNAGIRFDENFGAGVENYLGDEFIFIADALRAGLTGIHLPVVIAVHPEKSSGSVWGTDTDLSARAKVFTRVFGASAPRMRLAFLLKTKNSKLGLLPSLKFIFKQ